MTEWELLQRIREEYAGILGGALKGLYVHGSLAFGCFRWACSDIDFLAVVSRPLVQRERVALIRALLTLAPEAPPKGMEMSVVTEDVCRSFIHPAPYELHFSNAHIDRFRADIEGYCRTMQGEDPDLAAHFAVTRAVGVALYGPPAAELFAPVPEMAVMDSICGDVADADMAADPVYLTLNLCRAMAYREESLLLSKADGGRWALARTPQRYHAAICSALEAYEGTGGCLPVREMNPFRGYALKRILGEEN